MHSLIRNLREAKATKKNAIQAAWITTLWISSSICMLGNVILLIDALTWRMDCPGGLESYMAAIWNKPVPIMIVTTYLLMMWIADAMMVSLGHIVCPISASDSVLGSYGGLSYFAMKFNISPASSSYLSLSFSTSVCSVSISSEPCHRSFSPLIFQVVAAACWQSSISIDQCGRRTLSEFPFHSSYYLSR